LQPRDHGALRYTITSSHHGDAEVLGYRLSSLAHHDDILVEESRPAAFGGVLSKRDEAAVNGAARLVQSGEIAGQSEVPSLVPDVIQRLGNALEQRDQSPRIIFWANIKDRRREGSRVGNFIAGAHYLRFQFVIRCAHSGSVSLQML
jgi:hypothetical protein